MHANLGHLRDRSVQQNAMLLNIAIEHSPSESWLVFAETQTNDRRSIFGGVSNAVGGVIG